MNLPLVENYVLMFFVCAVLGWVMEVTCKLIELHRFINRGFLIGPYCPIYGWGAVLVSLSLSRYASSPVIVFIMAMVVCGTLEYLTSYFMEKLFHARWWDYSNRRFNLNGRVCANTLIPFGLLGLTMVYLVKPFLFGLFDRLSGNLRLGLAIGVVVIMIADHVISIVVLGRIRHTAELTGGDDTETLTRLVREKLQSNALVRRAMRAFPGVRLYNRDIMRLLKEKSAQLKAEFNQREARRRESMERSEEKFRENLQQLRQEKKNHRHS